MGNKRQKKNSVDNTKNGVSNVNGAVSINGVSNVNEVSNMNGVSNVNGVSNMNGTVSINEVNNVNGVSNMNRVSNVNEANNMNEISNVNEVNNMNEESEELVIMEATISEDSMIIFSSEEIEEADISPETGEDAKEPNCSETEKYNLVETKKYNLVETKKYNLMVMKDDQEMRFELDSGDAMEDVYNSLFEEQKECSILYEGIKISRYLNASECGFLPGTNYLTISDKSKRREIDLVFTIQVSEDENENMKYSPTAIETFSDISSKIKKEKKLEEKTAKFVFNGITMDDSWLIKDHVKANDVIDVVFV